MRKLLILSILLAPLPLAMGCSDDDHTVRRDTKVKVDRDGDGDRTVTKTEKKTTVHDND